MNDEKIIDITKHALERLEERVVLPMIKGGHKEFLSNRNNAEKALYSIVNIGRRSLTPVEDKTSERGGVFYDMKFRSYDGEIPLRGLVRDYALVTIWPLGGWRRVMSQS
ncbi:MAG: hypothetical protein VXA41_05450 [Euryarchaeota archaeon]